MGNMPWRSTGVGRVRIVGFQTCCSFGRVKGDLGIFRRGRGSFLRRLTGIFWQPRNLDHVYRNRELSASSPRESRSWRALVNALTTSIARTRSSRCRSVSPTSRDPSMIYANRNIVFCKSHHAPQASITPPTASSPKHKLTAPGDYCDVYLTHDSMSVRKAHNSGRNHLRNVVDYYQRTPLHFIYSYPATQLPPFQT